MEAVGNVSAVQAELRRLAGDIQANQSALIERALDDLIAQLVPATPVSAKQHKHMFESYTSDVQGGVGLLGNEKDYAKWVIGGTSRMHGNAALNDVIDSAQHDIADRVGLELTRLVNRYR